MENLKLLSKIALSFHEVENFDKDIVVEYLEMKMIHQSVGWEQILI